MYYSVRPCVQRQKHEHEHEETEEGSSAAVADGSAAVANESSAEPSARAEAAIADPISTQTSAQVGVGVQNPALTLTLGELEDGTCAGEKSGGGSSCGGACASCASEAAALELKVDGNGIDSNGAVIYQAAPAAGAANDALAVCHCMDHVVLPNEIAVKARASRTNLFCT